MIIEPFTTIIFLDIDGVLVTGNGIKNGESESNRDKYGEGFDSVAVANLERIIKFIPNTKIVLSSSWRHGKSLEEMQLMWKERRLPGELIDYTPTIRNTIRGTEIDQWLMKHKWYDHNIITSDLPGAFREAVAECNISNYVIIDDDPDMHIEQLSRFVKTTFQRGIDEEAVKQAKLILSTTKVSHYQFYKTIMFNQDLRFKLLTNSL